MSKSPLIDSYLNQLEIYLGPLPIAEKSEIIAKANAHINSSLPAGAKIEDVQTVLLSLGPAKKFAESERKRLGLAPFHPKRSTNKHPWYKWPLTFMGMFALFLLVSFGVLFWKFTPFIEADEKTGSLKLFGGAINLQGGQSSSYYYSSTSNGQKDQRSQVGLGQRTLEDDDKRAVIQFENGNLTFEQHNKNEIHYKCQSDAPSKVFRKENALVFNFTGPDSSCHFKLPEDLGLEIDGQNARVSLKRLKNSVELDLANGQVAITPALNAAYRYDLKLQNGSIDSFESSDRLDAYQISIEADNGSITLDSVD